MKTWEDIERAARGEPWTEQTKYIISGEPILWQVCNAVRCGRATREEALIQAVFALIEVKNDQQQMIAGIPQHEADAAAHDSSSSYGGRMSHTSGPWRVDCVEVYGANNKHVVWELGSDNPADWALIAAAPDLLAALKDLVRATDNPASGALGDPWDVARAAIAKAEGRSA